MRIETYTQVQQLYGSNKPSKTAPAQKKSFRDQLEISSAGKEVSIAKQAVTSSPDIRESVVAPIKARIADGSYSVDAGDFASKLIEKYNETR